MDAVTEVPEENPGVRTQDEPVACLRATDELGRASFIWDSFRPIY